jgi:MFS family permease
MTHVVPHAENVGISSRDAAMVMTVLGFVATVARIPEGFLADKIGIRKTSVILTVVLVLSLGLLSAANTSLTALYIFAIVFGLAFGSLDIILSLLPPHLFGLVALGAIIGVQNAVICLGGAIGPVVSGLIFDSTGSYQLSFVVSAGLSLVALAMMILIRPLSKSHREPETQAHLSPGTSGG